MNLVDGISSLESLFNDKNTLVGRFAQSLVNVVNLDFLIVDKSVHALADHAEAFLNHFFEGAADGHHFADALHGRTQFAVNATEFSQVPARDFADNVVECWFEEGACCFRHRVLELEEAVTQSQFGGNESQRIARCF